MTSIRRATADEGGPIAALIAEAFAGLEASAWVVPDAGARARILSGSFRILTDHALQYGYIDLVDGLVAAGVWIPSTAPEPFDYERRMAAACAPWTDRFRVLDSLFRENGPDAEHHHLVFLAVHPDVQGKGLGSELLRRNHAHLDAVAMPAYLEASSAASRDLYLRHGYQARRPFTLPDGTPFWPMWRSPIG